jgi:hypothetical protein
MVSEGARRQRTSCQRFPEDIEVSRNRCRFPGQCPPPRSDATEARGLALDPQNLLPIIAYTVEA